MKNYELSTSEKSEAIGGITRIRIVGNSGIASLGVSDNTNTNTLTNTNSQSQDQGQGQGQGQLQLQLGGGPGGPGGPGGGHGGPGGPCRGDDCDG